MSDKMMDDINKGKGLPPIPSNCPRGSQSGVPTEKRGDAAIRTDKFSCHDNPKRH